jgi:hypothetical protein
MKKQEKRITIVVEEELHNEVKKMATEKRTTIRIYTTMALLAQLKSDKK